MTSRNALPGEDFEIEETDSSDGVCDCCGTRTIRVSGLVRHLGYPLGAYFVSWTDGKPDHGAIFDLILGKWDEDATSDDRYSVSLDHRVIDGSPQWMVIDSTDRVVGKSDLVGTALKREEVIGTPLAPQVFAVVDAIYIADHLQPLRNWCEDLRQ